MQLKLALPALTSTLALTVDPVCTSSFIPNFGTRSRSRAQQSGLRRAHIKCLIPGTEMSIVPIFMTPIALSDPVNGRPEIR
jgi:hypothetical protein